MFDVSSLNEWITAAEESGIVPWSMLGFSSIQLTKLRHCGPSPPWRESRKSDGVGDGRFLIISFSRPLSATFGKNTFEEFAGWFHVRILLAPVFGQFTFDGGFENGGSVAFEVGLGPLE